MEDSSLLRLLQHQFGAGEIRVLVGQMPEHWPLEVSRATSLMEDVQVIGSFRWWVLLETRLLPEQFLAAYHRALTSQGARLLRLNAPTSMDGSELANVGRSRIRLQDGVLHVEAFRMEGEIATDVRLRWAMESDLDRRPFSIPSLTPPLDAPQWYLEMAEFRKGSDLALFRATVASDTSDVLEYFAQQLAHTGWQRVTQEANCITWWVPRPEEEKSTDARGTLSVLEWLERDNQKVIMVHVET
jgi:hypothetical protein